jgi:hypothetical protein
MRRRSARPEGASERERRDVLDESAAEVSPEELREFLEADLLGVQADPVFKEALRRKLWALVREKYGRNRES